MSTALPPHPPAPTAPVAVLANAAALAARDADLGAPSFDALLHHLRQEVARVLDLHPDARHKEEQALLSLANRALARYTSPDKSAIPPPLLQIDAYQRAPNPAESLSKYLSARRAVLALDPDDPMDGGDKDAIGEPAHDSLDAGRDSDEDAIGSEHPRSPSLRPSDSPLAVHRQLEPRLPTPTPSSPRPTSGTAGNTTGELALPPYQFRNRANPFPTKAVSSPEPRSTVSAPPRGGQASDEKKPAAPPDSVDHTFKGDERCSNCISRNNPTCIVNSSRQRCDSCFVKRHRCSKVLTPPSRPSRESNSTSNNGGSVNKTASTSKGKAAGDAPATTNGESASARGPKRKRPAADAEEDTKRPEPAKRPVRPQRPTTTAPIASTSASASAPPARAPAPKREKPPAPNGVGVAATSASAGPNALAALAASASRAPRAPVNAQAPAGTRQQQYLDKLQVIAGILEMVQNSVKDLQDQIKADSAVRR